ncbi:hypothetical protein [Actinomadura flavalba]|uniref:hypothetical protein n=1 Tax=Actinomadura flavalba TaxID=1120938 RepID=UPI00037B41F5|nr:hypothetical protein [Actinomadura flavalba]
MSEDEKRARLTEIEKTLRSLRGELGDNDDEPADFGDSGQDLQARAERDGQMEVLEQERDRLRAELGE